MHADQSACRQLPFDHDIKQLMMDQQQDCQVADAWQAAAVGSQRKMHNCCLVRWLEQPASIVVQARTHPGNMKIQRFCRVYE